VFIKITLDDTLATEDILTDTIINCDYGYHVATTTDPNTNIELFQTGGHTYVFVEREPPIFNADEWISDIEYNNFVDDEYVETGYVE